ncbi:MAG TPA: hypothetical protein VEL76_04055, partial [Gemmataceae bacterium]|nr:hypothetical protein [Gemmataceae bacterium]
MMRKPSQQANSVPTSRIDNPFEVTILSKGLALVFVCGLVVSLSGCQGHEEIRSYQVPREQPLRMLGAIVPHGEVVWFVKLVGPEPAVEEQKQQFRDLVLSFRFDDKAGLPLTWTTPKGWREVRDDRRYGTFQIGPKEDGLEVTVFDLGRKGGGGSVLANVNRWRGQLGLWPTTPGELTGLPVLGPSSLGLLGGPSGQSPFLATS